MDCANVQVTCERRLTSIETKLDTVLERVDSFDKRITSLERWKNWVLGAGTAIGAGFGFFADKIKDVLTR